MAAASYTTDLALINAADAANANWTEPSGFVDGAITLPETDYFIQGAGCLSKTMGASSAATSGAIFNAGAGQSIPSGNAVLVWLFFGAPNALATQANGGLRVLIGSGTAAFKQWYVRGSNTYTYGGWVCVPVDPNTTQDATTGSPTATLQYFGAAAVLGGVSAVSRGNPLGIDVLRHGRCEMRINGGDLANGYATFAGFAAQNDSTSNRWGLFQAVDGGYLWQGLMTLGHASAVDFRDTNVSIQIANTQKVGAAFNRIEVRQAASRVDWTGVNITALGTVSRGQFEAIDDADINLLACTFTEMDTFVFRANTTVEGCVFRRCGRVTQGSAIIGGATLFEDSRATAALLANNLDNVSDSTFNSSGTGHAIELTAAHAGGSYTLTDVFFTGYATSNGSTGNEAIYNNSGGAVTINVVGGSTPSIRNGAGATTSVVSGSVTVTLTATTATGTAIADARVMVAAAAGGPFPTDASVTISNSGTTATVTHTGHPFASGDKVLIKGASHAANRGVFSIAVTGANTYTYTMASAPGSNPTGAITSTFVLLSGTTNGAGQITMSRVFPNDQPVSGWARKSSAAPYYKTGPVAGTVSSASGATLTALLVSDE